MICTPCSNTAARNHGDECARRNLNNDRETVNVMDAMMKSNLHRGTVGVCESEHDVAQHFRQDQRSLGMPALPNGIGLLGATGVLASSKKDAYHMSQTDARCPISLALITSSRVLRSAQTLGLGAVVLSSSQMPGTW